MQLACIWFALYHYYVSLSLCAECVGVLFTHQPHRNTKSYMLSLTQCVWEFQNNALWDTLIHGIHVLLFSSILFYFIFTPYLHCVIIRSMSAGPSYSPVGAAGGSASKHSRSSSKTKKLIRRLSGGKNKTPVSIDSV